MDRQPLTWRHAAALAAAMAIGAWLVAPRLAQPASFDAVHFYLPMARHLIAAGPAFFSDPQSLAYAPLAYVYPALMGGDERLVRLANVALFCGAIALAFAAARAAHSRAAGLLAALFVAISPTIRPYIGDALTEPLFLFLVAAWSAGIGAITRGHRIAGAAAAGLALALAALTRPAVMYYPLAALVLFAWRAWRAPREARADETAIALAHLLPIAICALVVARNALVFGYPAIAAGAGNALFHGVNAMVDGFDPVYYGLSYDDGSVTRGVSPLSIEGDRMLRAAALHELAALHAPVIAAMIARKAVAFVFVTPAESLHGIVEWRLWRVAMVVLASAALAFVRRSPIVVALASLAGYLWAVHLPLLYHHRYSVGALDIPLSLLAGIGLAACLPSAARVGAVAIAMILAGGLALASLAGAGPQSPHPSRSPHAVVWSRGPLPPAHLAPGAWIEVAVENVPGFHPWNHYVLMMQASAGPDIRGTPCPALLLRYKGAGERDYPPQRPLRIPLRADGAFHSIALGAVPLGLNREGTLALGLDCPGGRLEVGSMAIALPRRGEVYAGMR